MPDGEECHLIREPEKQWEDSDVPLSSDLLVRPIWPSRSLRCNFSQAKAHSLSLWPLSDTPKRIFQALSLFLHPQAWRRRVGMILYSGIGISTISEPRNCRKPALSWFKDRDALRRMTEQTKDPSVLARILRSNLIPTRLSAKAVDRIMREQERSYPTRSVPGECRSRPFMGKRPGYPGRTALAGEANDTLHASRALTSWSPSRPAFSGAALPRTRSSASQSAPR